MQTPYSRLCDWSRGEFLIPWDTSVKPFPFPLGLSCSSTAPHNQKQKQKPKESNIERLRSTFSRPWCNIIGISRLPHSCGLQEPGRHSVCVFWRLLFHERGGRNSTSIAENCFKIPPTEEPLLQSLMHWGTDTGGTLSIVNIWVVLG